MPKLRGRRVSKERVESISAPVPSNPAPKPANNEAHQEDNSPSNLNQEKHREDTHQKENKETHEEEIYPRLDIATFIYDLQQKRREKNRRYN